MRTPVRFGYSVLLATALALFHTGSDRSGALAATTLTVTITNDSGVGSLRQAITDGNTNSPPVTINFAIAPFDGTVKTIPLESGDLPPITNSFFINGFSQSGASAGTSPGTLTNNPVLLIALDGSFVGGGPMATGLTFAVAGSVQGLIVQNFPSIGFSVVSGATLLENILTNNLIGILFVGDTNRCAGNFLLHNNIAVSVLGSSNTVTLNQILDSSSNGVTIAGISNSFTGNLIASNLAQGVVINGGTNTLASATISFNGSDGIYVSGDGNSFSNVTLSANGSDGLDIQAFGNILINGTVSSNVVHGVNIGGVSGGFNVSAGSNTLSGVTVFANGGDGVILGGNSNSLVGSTISSNTGDGVFVLGVGNIVGGTAAGAGNAILENLGNGIDIAAHDVSGSGPTQSDFNVVQGNFIGTDVTGTNDLGNSQSGILIDGTLLEASGNLIGGDSSGQGNTIAFNESNGVTVVSNAVANAIFGNSIFTNAVLGIDLGADGVTPNHPFGVVPSDPNLLQNFPVLTAALCSNAGVLIQGIITNAAASTPAHLEFFANTVCDPSGFGQGQTFLGSADVTTDLSGGATFSVAFTNFDLVGEFVTATASDSSSNTSEFSQCMLVTDTQPPIIIQCASPITSPTGSNDCQAVMPDFTGAVVATDNCSPSNDLTITQSPTNGTIAFLGTNTVTITVSDLDGNSTNCTTSFIVVDQTPPQITCQSSITNNVGSTQSSAVVTFPTPTATDNCSTATVTCVPASGRIFPLGTTPVVCTAVDPAGNTASCTFNVTVTAARQVIVDIAPRFCPNVLNTKGGGVLEVAIVGTESLNVSNIIPASVTLNGVLNDGNFAIEDVAVPFVYTKRCPKKKHDGIPDLVVEFDVDQLVASLGTVKNRQILVLTVTGTMLDGTTLETFEGQDKIKISTKKCKLPKGLKNPF